jgi:hypothetical protein
MEKFKYCLDHPETVKDVIPGWFFFKAKELISL